MSACSTKKQESPKFYTLAYPTDKKASISAVPSLLEYRFSIEEVTVNPVFASQLIVLRKESHAIQYFAQHEWAARPQQSLTAFLTQFYNENSLFSTGHITSYIAPQIRLHPHVYRLEIIQKDRKTLLAHLDVEFILREVKTGNIILSHREQTKEPLTARDINLFAQTISEQYFYAVEAFTKKAIKVLSGEGNAAIP